MRKRLLLPVICMVVLALSGCAKKSTGNAEISTEMHHKYLESCSCPADEDGVVRKHLDGCEVPKISEKVEIVADMYTSNRITKDGYATYRYVVTDKEYAGYFDKKNHISILDEYKGLLEEVLATVSAQDTRPRCMLNVMYMHAQQGTTLTQEGMKVLNFNENDPKQVAEKVKVKNMNAKNIRCLVQNYFIDTDGNILSDKISEKYFGGKKALDLSEEQLEWAKLAAEDELNMSWSSFDEFMENYYNALTDGQMKVWNEIWGVEY